MTSIELKSPEVHDILNRPPKGLIRWGSGLLFGILLTFFAGSYFFNYPEVVEAQALITTTHPPVWLTARATASISELHGTHLMQVKQGQLIAVLENAANTDDVMALRQQLADSSLYRLENLIDTPHSLVLTRRLGELQTHWTQVVNRFTEYYLTTSVDNYESRRDALLSELRILENKLKALERKKNSQNRVLIIQKERFRSEQALFEKGIISRETYQQAEQELLAIQQMMEETRLSLNSLLSDKIGLIQSLEKESLLRNRALLTQEHAYLLAIKELASALETWEQTYLIISPVDGILTFPETRNPLQQIQKGDKLVAVVPDEPGALQAFLTFKLAGSGKVRPGQTVRIFIDGYPFLEYGSLTAIIRSISLIPDAASTYTAVASVPNPLRTNYDKLLDFRGELTGTAKIRTNELRLIQRVVHPLKYVFKNQR